MRSVQVTMAIIVVIFLYNKNAASCDDWQDQYNE